jgi:hypothetical protein
MKLLGVELMVSNDGIVIQVHYTVWTSFERKETLLSTKFDSLYKYA